MYSFEAPYLTQALISMFVLGTEESGSGKYFIN